MINLEKFNSSVSQQLYNHSPVGLETLTAENWGVTKGFQMATQTKTSKVSIMRHNVHIP